MIERLTTWLTPSDRLEARVRVELLRTVALHHRRMLFSIPVIALADAFIAMIWIDGAVALAWCAAVIVAAGIVYIANEPLVRAAPRPEDAGYWTLRLFAGETPFFFAWSALIWLAWVDGNAGNNVFVCVFMLASMSVASTLFGAFFPLGALHCAIYIVLAGLYAFEFSPDLPWLGAAVQVVYGFATLGVCSGVAQAARASVELQIRNQELIGQLAVERDRADRANQAKSNFLAAMSHDLRTPLNGIIGYADLIKRGAHGPIQPARYGSYIDNMRASGQHLLGLINEVLDLAKIEAGKRQLEKETFDVVGLAASAAAFIETQAEKAGVTLSYDVADGTMLNADKRAILQVLTNLLSNAVKFTKAGGRVVVFGRHVGDTFQLGVEDNGTGMTAEGLKKALEPFGQAVQATTVEGRGTGLGLPIVKGLVEAHGATFHIESVAGAGTKVWAAFPRAHVSRGATAASAAVA